MLWLTRKTNASQVTCWIRSRSVLVTASYGRYGQRTARIWPDRIYLIQLPVSDSGPCFSHQRRHGSYCAKPTRLRSARPGQGLAKRIWSGSKPVCQIIGPGFWQDATGPLPVSHFQIRLRSCTDGPNHIALNRPGSDLVFWMTVSGFGQTDPVRKLACVKESSGPLLANASELIRIGYANRIRHVYWERFLGAGKAGKQRRVGCVCHCQGGVTTIGSWVQFHQTPGTCLPHPSSNHCRNWLRHTSPKTVT